MRIRRGWVDLNGSVKFFVVYVRCERCQRIFIKILLYWPVVFLRSQKKMKVEEVEEAVGLLCTQQKYSFKFFKCKYFVYVLEI